VSVGSNGCERLRTVHRDRDGRDHEVEIVLQCPSLDDEDGAGHLIVAVARDISEQLTTERRILEAERELSLLDDRERIARDLHDTVIQKLFASGMALQATLMTAQGPLRDKLEQCVEDLDDAIRDLRTAIFGLRGDAVNADAPQARLLRIAAEESVVLGFHPQVAFVGAVDQLDGVLTADLEAVLRELLSNVGRHAAATRVEVTIEVDDEVRLTVHDNGNGVDKIAPIGNGRRSLAERATMRGGQFHLAPSAHSSGTIATWVVQRPEEGDS
jgi:signal transduction histidine kinase